ncbi:uncharacterized protein [Haliotis asinina]|uniref:uncharacterized protein n=1 Tax=Haliotis asinina TaxID=109174 RepID=UPI003531E6BA
MEISSDLPHNDCGEPPPCANTYRTFPDNNTVEYRCIDTYVLSAGDLVRHCVDGKYNGTCPVCTLDCGPPLNTSYASITSTGTEGGDKVTYTCPDGFLVSSTETECSVAYGYWWVGDRCFANSSLDVAAFTAVQTSTATLDDILNTTAVHLQLPPDVAFNATYAVDPTKLGVSLANGECSSTARERRPHMNVTLGSFYDIFQVAVTLPDDAFAYSLPNLEVKLQNHPTHRWSTCMKHTAIIPVGSRFVATCRGHRYPGYGKYIQLEADFGDNLGMLQICRIEVYARPITSVDCGQPPLRPFSMLTRRPSTTHHNRYAERVSYECIEGYSVKGGRTQSSCNVNGYWTGSVVCTADDNLSHDKPVSLASNASVDVCQLTDGNMSSCAVAHGVTERTFVIELGRDVEVGDVSITYFASKHKYPVTTVTVWRDGYDNSSCPPHSINYVPETANVQCPSFPVGRYVGIRIKFKETVDLDVCEIMVHGRPYNEALECFRKSKQTDYKGHLNVTVTGIPCQRWDSQTPHAHTHTDISKFPDDNLEDAANYCRNPEGKHGLWCYTINPDVEWQYCPLRSCDLMCMQDDKGLTYKGSIQKTSSGARCIAWSNRIIPFKQRNHFSNFWHGMNYCRNPLLSQSQPWCYTNAANASQYEFCDVPETCPTTSQMTRSRWVADVHQTFDDLLPSTECLVWNRLYTTDGNFTATWDDAFKPVLYRNTFTAGAVCHKGRVFNTYLLCFNITESGTVWKAGVLECVHCGSAPSVENATVTISSSLLNGIATYACVTGYGHASGSNRIICLKTGEWEVPDIICEVDCGTPPTLDHADVNVSSTLVGQTANYTCHHGYAHLSVSIEVTCLDTGKWDFEDMKCEVNCGDPPSINRTEVSSTDGFVNETAEYTCKPGYVHVSGSAVIMCLGTGTWETPEIYCEVDCSTPPTLDHADVDVNSTLFGNTANYTCHDGYAHLSGSTQVTCLNTGKWEILQMKCEVDCGTPPTLDHAEVDVNSTLFGNTANYTCQDGYSHLSGSTQVTCLDTGKWDVAELKCEVNCGDPPSINRTEVSPTDGFLNETVEYTCKPGYAHVSGTSLITCLDTGTWEEPGIYCEVDCSTPPVVANTVMISDNTTLNSTVVYMCSLGFVHVSGSTHITCLDSGFWEIPFIECVADCGQPPQFTNTHTTYNSTLFNSTADYTCSDGTAHVSGLTQVTCQYDGNWTETDISCLVDCGVPPQVINTNVTYNSTLISGRAEYTCVHGTAHASGSTQITCQSDGNWTISDMSCLEVQSPSRPSSSTITELPVDKYGRTRTEKCICRCINLDLRKPQDAVAQISKNLTLETKTLLSSVMKKESLPDERKSSHFIAYVAMAVIGVLFGVVFVSDICFFINKTITLLRSH